MAVARIASDLALATSLVCWSEDWGSSWLLVVSVVKAAVARTVWSLALTTSLACYSSAGWVPSCVMGHFAVQVAWLSDMAGSAAAPAWAVERHAPVLVGVLVDRRSGLMAGFADDGACLPPRDHRWDRGAYSPALVCHSADSNVEKPVP